MSTPAQPGMNTGLQNVDWVNAMQNTGWFDKQKTPMQNTVIPQSQYQLTGSLGSNNDLASKM